MTTYRRNGRLFPLHIVLSGSQTKVDENYFNSEASDNPSIRERRIGNIHTVS